MTERERLVELLKNDNCPSPFICDANCKYINSENCLAERMADYLLENGVIAPPCRVGDTMYVEFERQVYPVCVYAIRINTKRKDKRICVDGIFAIEYPYGSYDYRYRANFKWKNVGKTIFYTREEAENALKERIEHND